MKGPLQDCARFDEGIVSSSYDVGGSREPHGNHRKRSSQDFAGKECVALSSADDRCFSFSRCRRIRILTCQSRAVPCLGSSIAVLSESQLGICEVTISMTTARRLSSAVGRRLHWRKFYVHHMATFERCSVANFAGEECVALELCSPSSIAVQEVSERMEHLPVPSATALQSRCRTCGI